MHDMPLSETAPLPLFFKGRGWGKGLNTSNFKKKLD
jgi:hypothetical protein